MAHDLFSEPRGRYIQETIEDRQGNHVYIQDGKVYLKLKGDGKARFIGVIEKAPSGLRYSKFEEESQVFRKLDAWSINHYVACLVDEIEYYTDKHVYRISTERALQLGEFVQLNSEAVEKKIYVPRKHWIKAERSPDFERELRLKEKLGMSWYEYVGGEFQRDYMKNLSSFIASRRKVTEVYPAPENVFKALQLTPYKEVKVVIVGQDPYHVPQAAHGLAFSVPDELKFTPPSLLNIIKEIEAEFGPMESVTKDLTYLAKQGVLLLNTILTVEKASPLSHSGRGWETFTSQVIKQLNKKPIPIAFLLWGKEAQKLKPLIDTKFHLVLEAPHPSPYSASMGFFGCDHFKKCNEFLLKTYGKDIKWQNG